MYMRHACGYFDLAFRNVFNTLITFCPKAFYPPFALTCMDLFHAGIRRSGSYEVNGTLQLCNFFGNKASFAANLHHPFAP